MLNFKKKVINPIKNSAQSAKHTAEDLNKNIRTGAEDLNKTIKSGAEDINKSLNHPWQYNYLIFALPMLLVLLAFIPMADWVLQIDRLIIFCAMGYVLFFEFRMPKRRPRVFLISLVLTILFNPIVPFYVPGIIINIASIVAMGYLAYETQMKHPKK